MSSAFSLTISSVPMLLCPGPQVAPTGRHMSSMSVLYDFSRASMFFIIPCGRELRLVLGGDLLRPGGEADEPLVAAGRLRPGHRRAVQFTLGVDVVVDVVHSQLDRPLQHRQPGLARGPAAVAAQRHLGDHESRLSQGAITHLGIVVEDLAGVGLFRIAGADHHGAQPGGNSSGGSGAIAHELATRDS